MQAPCRGSAIEPRRRSQRPTVAFALSFAAHGDGSAARPVVGDISLVFGGRVWQHTDEELLVWSSSPDRSSFRSSYTMRKYVWIAVLAVVFLAVAGFAHAHGGFGPSHSLGSNASSSSDGSSGCPCSGWRVSAAAMANKPGSRRSARARSCRPGGARCGTAKLCNSARWQWCRAASVLFKTAAGT